MDTVVERRRSRVGKFGDHGTIARHDPAARQHQLGARIAQRLDQHNVGQLARRDRAQVAQAIARRAIQRREADRQRWIYTVLDQDADAAIHVAVLEQIGWVDIVGADRHIPGVRDLAERACEIGGHMSEGVFSAVDPHSGAQLLDHLAPVARLVVRVDPGGQVGR